MDLNLSPFGWFHTALSIAALVSGSLVVFGVLTGRPMGKVTALFIAAALATSVTAFGFAGPLDPAKIIGIVSLGLLLLAITARYLFHVVGPWRWIYAVTAVFTLYFLVFVTIAEAFKRVPALKAMAPTLTERSFKLTQLVCLAAFVVLAFVAARRFRYVRS